MVGEKAFYAQPMFILKATVALPIIALIVFCIKQYAHERDYEELYAFKSALSFSLSPYIDLVRDLAEAEQSQESRTFVMKTIDQVFSDPLVKLDSDKKVSKKDSRAMKELIEAPGKLVDKFHPFK